MKNSNFSLPIASIMGCFLIFGVTSGLSAKEIGFYLHGGVTYWDGLDAPDFEDEIGLEDVSIDYEIDGSRAQLSLGVGYHLNENLSVEAFYVSTPEQVVSGNDWMFPPFEPGGDPITLSWNASVKQTIGGVNAVYDVYVNENLSLFGKAGMAFVRHSSETSVIFQNQPSTVFQNVIPSSFTDEEDTQDIFGAIGVRVPIRQGDASLTFAYQFIETDDGRETSFEIGLQWNL